MKRLLLLVVILALAGFYVGWPAWSGYQISQAFKTHDAATLERKVDFESVRVGIRPLVAKEVDKAIDRMQRDAGPLTGAFAAALRKDLAPRIVDSALRSFVTPENVVRMAQRGGSVRDMVRQSVAEQTQRGGARAAPLETTVAPTGTEAPRPRGNLAGMMDRFGRSDGLGSGAAARAEPVAPPAAAPPPGAAPAETADPPPSAAPAGGEAPPRQRLGFSNIKHFRITGPVSFEIGINRRAEAEEPEVIAEMAFRGGDWKVVRVVPRIEP